ncbi:MAG TPA: hypothetical protein VFV62_03435, partial [Gaiellaceae bacterium]|nr:hypothetical protein [Gaiellaceae bacterium]
AATNVVPAKKEVVVAVVDVLAEKKAEYRELASDAAAAAKKKLQAERDLRAFSKDAPIKLKALAAHRLVMATAKLAALSKARDAAKAVVAEATPKVVEAKQEVVVAVKTAAQIATEAKAAAEAKAFAEKRDAAIAKAAAEKAARTAAIRPTQEIAIAASRRAVSAMYERLDATRDFRAAKDSSLQIRARLAVRLDLATRRYAAATKESNAASAALQAVIAAYDAR